MPYKNYKWESLFSSIRNEPIMEPSFVCPIADPTKGWCVEWGADLSENGGKFEILGQVSMNLYVEIGENNGKVSDFRIKQNLHLDTASELKGENAVPEITMAFLSQNPKEEMQFIPLSPVLAVLIFTSIAPYRKKKIWKLVKVFPNAPDPRVLNRAQFDEMAESAEKNMLKDLNLGVISMETKFTIDAFLRQHREAAWMYQVTGHPDIKEHMDLIISLMGQFLDNQP